MPSYKEACPEFLNCPVSAGRTKLPKKKVGLELSEEEKRPDVWVCRDQDPSPIANKRRSWKPIRVINKPGYFNSAWGK